MNLALKGILILNFHRLLYPIILCFLAFTFFVSDSEAKVKTVYKLLVTDYRGNRWIDYTAVDGASSTGECEGLAVRDGYVLVANTEDPSVCLLKASWVD